MTTTTPVVDYYVLAKSNGGYAPYGALRDMWQCKDPEIMIAGPYGTGKGNIMSSVVMTPSGPRQMGDLAVGDRVLSQDGSATTVTGVFPQPKQPIYRVVLHDGQSTLVTGDHWWRVGERKYRRKSNKKRTKIRGSGHDRYSLVETNFLRKKRLNRKVGSNKDTRRRYWLPTAEPAQFFRRPLKIDPYVMGILISEGGLSSGSASFTTGDMEIAQDVSKRVADADITIRKDGISYAIVNATGDHYTDRLRYYGLWGKLSYEKFVPEDYLYTCVSERKDLLRGLMDGDGTIGKNGDISYTSTSKRLVDDLRLLVESLGGYISSVSERKPWYEHNGEKREGRMAYTAHLVLPTRLNPFTLKRKLKRLKIVSEPRRFIDSIEYSHDEEAVCISVDHPSRLYLTDHFIVTHNTYAALQKLHGLLIKYPNSRALMVRKSYKALIPSALATYYNKVLPRRPGHRKCPVQIYGGGKPDWTIYPNGSRIILGGLDNPEKVLSSEYDFIFVPQAEELSLHDWEQLSSRNTGRAGNSPYPQMIGDCNPDVPTHWILNRPRLTVFHSKHTDNPMLYVRDRNGELALNEDGKPIMTEEGVRSDAALRALTGVRYKRGYLGLWVGAEGIVYENFNPDIHVVDDIAVQPYWRKFRVFDFGYNHPFVCQFWAIDHDDVLYLWKEFYMTGRTVRQHVEGLPGRPGIRQMSYGHNFEANICDWDAEDRATLEDMLDIDTISADKRISTGIEAVQNRLKLSGNNKPRIILSRNAIMEVDDELKMRYQPTQTIEEFPSYVWRKLKEDSEHTSKDETPVKQADHGMDAMKYMVAYLDGQVQYGKPGTVKYA